MRLWKSSLALVRAALSAGVRGSPPPKSGEPSPEPPRDEEPLVPRRGPRLGIAVRAPVGGGPGSGPRRGSGGRPGLRPNHREECDMPEVQGSVSSAGADGGSGQSRAAEPRSGSGVPTRLLNRRLTSARTTRACNGPAAQVMTCARRQAGAQRPASSTAADSARPDPRSGRRRGAPFFLFPALALLLGALSPFAAAPAAADVLVSNVQVSNYGVIQVNAVSRAQAFTTGDSPLGYYPIESIGVRVSASRLLTADELSRIKVQLWSSRQNGAPDQKIADLTVPSSAGNQGTRSPAFAAPPGTRLTANTTYNLVIYTTGTAIGSGQTFRVGQTIARAEDTAASGWSIANVSRWSRTVSNAPTRAC